MPSQFISDKTAEATSAMQQGDGDRAAKALIEAINENDGSFEETVTAMTQAANQQNGRR